MKLKTVSPLLLLSARGIFFFLSLFSTASADLTYYMYAEEEEQSDQIESTTIVLRSIGSLPLDRSTFTQTGDACPESVWEAGGVNPKFLCVGASHPSSPSQKSNSTVKVNGNAAIFPIEASDDSNNFLNFKFSAFQRSRGTPTGLLPWRDSIVVELDVAINEDQPQFLDAVSLGKDTSKDRFNANLLNSHEDGEVLGEWYLLTEKGGDRILDGGKIQFVKGKPQSTTHNSNEGDENVDISSTGTNGAALATANDVAVSAEEPELEQPIANTCESIADVICADENNDRYGTLCSLTMQVGIDQMLSYANGNMFTLYAPTNDGFSRAFVDRSPALLAGHDLTKLILNHLIVSETTETTQSGIIGMNPPKEALKYENMVCGTKLGMASGQIAKIGCDANAEVAFVVGSGNGGVMRPKFLHVDQQTCNGVIHTVDFVVLPTSQQQIHSHVHQGAVADIAAGSSSNTNAIDGTSAAGAQQNIPQIPVTFDSETNQLDQSEIMSFFAQTKQDLLEESGPVIPPTMTNKPSVVVETTTTVDSRVEKPAEKIPMQPEETSTNVMKDFGSEEPDQKEKEDGVEAHNGVDTQATGFHSFFSRNKNNNGRNLRRR